MGESAIRGRDGRGAARRRSDGGKQHPRRGERETDRIHPGNGDGQSAHHAGLHRRAGAEAQGAAEALLLGKWDAFDGQAFPEFVDDPSHYEDGLYTHVIKPFKIPWHWTRVVSFDHGYTRPFSFGVWAVDEEGRVYRYKELYGCVPGEANVGVTCPPGEIARQLADLMEPEFEEGIHVCGIADPAIWDRSRGLSVEEQIRKVFNGVIFMKGDNTRLPGKMQLHERLKFDEEGRPMLYVFENCRDFRRTIPALVYDARRPEDIDTAGEDHIYDETRYFLMSRPIAPRPRKGFDE